MSSEPSRSLGGRCVRSGPPTSVFEASSRHFVGFDAHKAPSYLGLPRRAWLLFPLSPNPNQRYSSSYAAEIPVTIPLVSPKWFLRNVLDHSISSDVRILASRCLT